MSTESDSAKAVSKALMISMELENEMKQKISQHNALIEVLKSIIEICEECNFEDRDEYHLDSPANTITQIRKLALDGLLSNSA